MKKILLFLAAFIILPSVCMFADGTQNIPIRVLDQSSETGHTHRGSDNIPIQAYYDDMSSSILISFTQDLGVVEISIENITDGTGFEFNVNSCFGVSILPFGHTEGLYLIYIVPSSGESYIGEFSID